MAAPRKAKSGASKKPAAAATTERPAATTERRAARQIAQPAGSGDPNRLLREAAWSRMFGRIESKNPFTR
jgi:hypothetical protein